MDPADPARTGPAEKRCPGSAPIFVTFFPFVLALAVLLIAVFGGEERIGKEAALQAALADAGLTRDQVRDVEIDLERGLRSGWYEIDFESGLTEYEYKVDAYSGEILSAKTDD